MGRLRFEAGGGEEDYVKKCMTCCHSYTRINESDTLFCGCRKGCLYKKRGSFRTKKNNVATEGEEYGKEETGL